ncbi:MAG: Asp23/Gls24 family envelope stress response protein [Clostridia bacterium]|nr:Asp23/Gls24 family envelope stress response protein [Clostridia bacterium]
MIAYDTRLGTVNFSDAYLSKLIGNAVSTCYGVVGMAPGSKKQQFMHLFSKKYYTDKGVIVRGNADSVIIEIHIIVSYGMNINAIAKSIVNKVRFTVTEMTGVKVEKVLVKVDGIQE